MLSALDYSAQDGGSSDAAPISRFHISPAPPSYGSAQIRGELLPQNVFAASPPLQPLNLLLAASTPNADPDAAAAEEALVGPAAAEPGSLYGAEDAALDHQTFAKKPVDPIKQDAVILTAWGEYFMETLDTASVGDLEHWERMAGKVNNHDPTFLGADTNVGYFAKRIAAVLRPSSPRRRKRAAQKDGFMTPPPAGDSQ